MDQRSDLELLLVHHPFDGAQVGPGNFTFYNREDTIALTPLLNEFDMVLAGHIHRRQVRYVNNTPIVYSGSTERTSIAEIDEQKGFVEIHLSSNLSYRFRDLSTRPMCKIEVPDVDDYEEYLENELSKLNPNSVVYVSFIGNNYLNEAQIRELAPPTMTIQSTVYRKRRSYDRLRLLTKL